MLFAGRFQQVSGSDAEQFVKDVAGVQDQARSQFTASLPGATSSLVADATHYIHVERPDGVVAAVRSIAARIP